MFSAETIWDMVNAVRERQPLIHNITNFVTMHNVANALLAIGASPAMVHATDEVEDFVAHAQALVINIGTLSSSRTAAIKLAITQARHKGIPWLLDPVGVGTTPYRSAVGQSLIYRQPRVIRGNASEILALWQRENGKTLGIDSFDTSDRAIEAAKRLALTTGAVVAVTGATDYVTDGDRIVALNNGHPLMTRVTGLGCSVTAVIGAFVAVEPDPLKATVAALSVFGLAGELAVAQAPGPGSLQVALLDWLYRLDLPSLDQRLRLRMLSEH